MPGAGVSTHESKPAGVSTHESKPAGVSTHESKPAGVSRRIPLWVTLLPLALGVLVWALLWRGYAADFRAELRAVLPAAANIETGGFPYRLEARIADLALRHDGVVRAGLFTRELVVNRVPWQRDRQVLVAFDPDMDLAIPAIAGASVAVKAPAAQASLHLSSGRIVRLSMVWPSGADIRSGLLPVPARAGHFEAHLRERETAVDGAVAQLVLSGEEVRFGDGAPLRLSLDADMLATAPLRALSAWTDGGKVAVREAVVADAGGEVARFSGHLRPEGGGLWLDGEIRTVCPATVRAAVLGARAAPEQRARTAQILAISGRFPGGLAIPPRDDSKPLPPVRGQEAPCPLLR